MQLFEKCSFCVSATHPTSHKIGTFLRIKQSCLECNQARVWDSQPFIANVPAGNILLSAAILFAGALPTQTLHILNHFNCAAILPKPFYNHQARYLQPVILELYTRTQKEFLSILKSIDKPL